MIPTRLTWLRWVSGSAQDHAVLQLPKLRLVWARYWGQTRCEGIHLFLSKVSSKFLPYEIVNALNGCSYARRDFRRRSGEYWFACKREISLHGSHENELWKEEKRISGSSRWSAADFRGPLLPIKDFWTSWPPNVSSLETLLPIPVSSSNGWKVRFLERRFKLTFHPVHLFSLLWGGLDRRIGAALIHSERCFHFVDTKKPLKPYWTVLCRPWIMTAKGPLRVATPCKILPAS